MNELRHYLDEVLSTLTLQSNAAVMPDEEYDIHEEVCRLIVDTRNELGMTQRQLAEISGMTQANISKIENGNTHPSVATLKKLADSMGRRLVIDFAEIEGVE